MALPYKLLKNITIDGETMGLDPNLGQIIATDYKNINLYAWQPTDGAVITLTEAGTYFIQNHTVFRDGSNTGRSYNTSETHVKRNGGNFENANAFTTASNGNETNTLNFDTIIVLEESEVPATIKAYLQTGVDRYNSFTFLRAYKLIHI